MKTCPNCQSKCKDFDLNIVNLADFKLIQKLANMDLNFGELGRLIYAMLNDAEAVQE